MTFSIRHHSVKEIVDKLEFTTIKDVNSAEDTVNGEKSSHSLEGIFVKDTFKKGLLSKTNVEC